MSMMSLNKSYPDFNAYANPKVLPTPNFLITFLPAEIPPPSKSNNPTPSLLKRPLDFLFSFFG